MMPLVTIVTPVFNGAELLKDTLDSIKRQSYQNIEYIIVDGGSTDGTLDLISGYEDMVNHVISEHDDGMYDALAKGLRVANGEIICYLNAGDMLYDKAVEVIVNIFTENNIKWITGFRSVCNDDNVITRVELPFRYKPHLIKQGVYGKWLPYIQQESTFWKKELLEYVDLDKLKTFELAGDYYLWYCFSKKSTLEVVKTPLGIFKKHEGQLSESIEKYWGEIETFTAKKNIITIFEIVYESFFWVLDSKIREKLVKNIWCFDFEKEKWTSGKPREFR